MLDISSTYPNGYNILTNCPCCGGKDVLSFHLGYSSVKCFSAKCELNRRTSLSNFATHYNLVGAFEEHYGVKLHALGARHALLTDIVVRNNSELDSELFWKEYVPFGISNENSKSYRYLLSRGISVENIIRFQLGRNNDDTGVMIPFYEYTKKGSVLTYYQTRNLEVSKYVPKYKNPKAVDKRLYNLYSMYPNQIRYGVEGIFDVIHFGDTYFAMLGSDFSDKKVQQILTYLDYLKETFNTVLKDFELSFIPDIGKENLDYWFYNVRKLRKHTEAKLSIVDLTTGTDFGKGINDAQQIVQNFEDGNAFVEERKAKRISVDKRKQYQVKLII
jgi:uncharacterized protein (DUF2164 family)